MVQISDICTEKSFETNLRQVKHLGSQNSNNHSLNYKGKF